MFKPKKLFLAAAAITGITFFNMPKAEAISNISQLETNQNTDSANHILQKGMKDGRIATCYGNPMDCPLESPNNNVCYDNPSNCPIGSIIAAPIEPNVTLPRTGGDYNTNTYYEPIPRQQNNFILSQITDYDLGQFCNRFAYLNGGPTGRTQDGFFCTGESQYSVGAGPFSGTLGRVENRYFRLNQLCQEKHGSNSYSDGGNCLAPGGNPNDFNQPTRDSAKGRTNW
jgi:hypothetical protein